MSSLRLLEHFDRVSEAPGAVARLRRFVLDLAVRGKLVEQEPHEEPATELLKRLRQEKRRFRPAEKSRDDSTSTALERAREPFRLPGSWVWAHFGELAAFSAGRTPPRHDSSYWNTGDYNWVSIADMNDDGVVSSTKETISEKAKVGIFRSEPAPAGTMVMSFKLTIGKISRLGVPAFHNEAIVSIRPYVPALEAYLFKVLPQFSRAGKTKGAIKGATLNRGSIASLLVALPPLIEQSRIVAKVDELMALCDRLEAAQVEREKRRNRGVVASLQRLNEPAEAPQFNEHAKFHFSHLACLTTRIEQVRELRQTFTNLAFCGRLSRQEQSDESAHELLQRIQAERCALVKTGELRQPKHHISTDGISGPFSIPNSWCWVTLSQIAYGFRYGTSVKCSYEADGEPVLRIPNVANGRVEIGDLKFGRLSAREAADLRLQLGDILMVRSNGSLDLVGRPAQVEAHAVGFCYAGYLVRVRTSVQLLNTRYLTLALSSRHVRDQIEIPIRSTVGLKNVNGTELGRLTMPLPPLAEQHRIAAQLDDLTAICDRLEVQINTAATESSRLLESLLHAALVHPHATQIIELQ